MLSLRDLRGKFMRGVRGVSRVDRDANYPSRFSWWPGGSAVNAVGSFQWDQFETHSHGTADAGAAFITRKSESGSLDFNTFSFQHDSFHRPSDRLHGR